MFSYHVTKKPRHGSVSHKTKEHLTKELSEQSVNQLKI